MTLSADFPLKAGVIFRFPLKRESKKLIDAAEAA